MTGRKVAVGPLALVAAGLLVVPAAAAKDTTPGEPWLPKPPPVAVAPAADPALAAARAIEDELARTVRRLLPAYVFVGGGSGVTISPDGYVLTNHHVAGMAQVWKVRTAGGRVYVADLVGTDPVGDILLLKMRGAENVPCLELGDSDRLAVGQTVIAIGNPFGLGMIDEAPTVTVGVVSAAHRYHGNYSDAIQTDAPVNPGNSGGPLLTLDGKVVGINGQIATRFGTRSNTGIGYAIPANQIRRFLPLLKAAKGGKVHHGTIRGLTLKPFDPSVGGEDKAVVGAVAPASTAAAAGLLPGDLIVSVAGEPVVNYARFAGVLGTWPAGAEIALVVRRGAEDKPLAVKLDVLPVPETVDFGWTLEPVNAAALRRNGGLKVHEVRKGGPADRAGLQAGDTLLELAGEQLATPPGVMALLRTGFESGRAVKGKLRRRVVEGPDPAAAETVKDLDFEVTPELTKPAPRADWGLALSGNPEAEGGFKVAVVAAGGAAEKAGIKPDDVLIELRGQKLTDAVQLETIFRESRPGQVLKGKLRRRAIEGEGPAAKEVASEVEFTLTLGAAGP